MARYLCPQCAVHYRASQFTAYNAQSEAWEPPRVSVPQRVARAVRALLGATGRDRDRERREHLEMLRLGVHHRCPQGHRMPAEFLRRETVPIGLVGPSSVSKSTYLAVLLHRIVGMTDLAPMGLTFTVEEHSRAVYQRDYVTPLAMRRPPEQTRLERTSPLVVRMHRDWAPEDDVNLLFFDAAGEGYRDARSSADLNPYLTVMAGALVFCSPVNLAFAPGSGFALPEGIEGATAPGAGTVVAALQSTRTVLERRRDPIPTAVVVAKCDELAALEARRPHPGQSIPLDPGFYGNEEGYLARQSRWPYDLLAAHGQAILAEVGRFSLLTRYHAVSATGCAVNNLGLFERIAPIRVHEPLLGLLHDMGLLEGAAASYHRDTESVAGQGTYGG
ncbi:hypothetical protein GA0111570_107132 [Raineyella antarctica]|uniref:Uncharacterized protein n=1 Tax=Raineyella antarctica TaxID=1577474 RepID=A0A1G6H9H6_9ACTN|nr:hypothetical protein [Raineyella antarctica]SDB90595.1 hypothetical protein GA0111570_107132 [Raineyella antarctica]